jgi:RNA 2',3'-cyclic 3'-phosphodiesterase
MASEPTIRLFVALDLPDRVRRSVVAWQGRWAGEEALRPLKPEALHVTLAFLGRRPAEDANRAAEIVRERGGSPVEMRSGGEPRPIPPRRPRLFALPLESEAAVDLQGQLAGGLEAAGLYEPEKRPFWPHVTVFRVRPAGRGARKPARVERAPEGAPEGMEHAFGAVRLALYRSDLRPTGAEYTSLAHVDLPPIEERG